MAILQKVSEVAGLCPISELSQSFRSSLTKTLSIPSRYQFGLDAGLSFISFICSSLHSQPSQRYPSMGSTLTIIGMTPIGVERAVNASTVTTTVISYSTSPENTVQSWVTVILTTMLVIISVSTSVAAWKKCSRSMESRTDPSGHGRGKLVLHLA